MDGSGESTENEVPTERYAKTLLDHVCGLTEVPRPLTNKRMTTIVCTVGGTTCDVITLEKMIGAGMNVAMLDMADGDHSHQVEVLQHIQKAVEFFDKKHVISYPLAVAIITVGPEMRLGAVKGGAKLTLIGGSTLTLTTDPAHAERGTAECVYVDYPGIGEAVCVGSPVLLDHGRVSLVVTAVEEGKVSCLVEEDAEVEGQSVVQLPGAKLDLPSVTEKDTRDLEFAALHEVDFVFASMVRGARDVQAVREALGEKGQHVLVIAKVENRQGVDNIDEIIRVSDGVMLVRKSLLTDIGLSRLFLAQRSVTARCNKAGKPVVVAQPMMETTSRKPGARLTEVSDIANFVISGVDCIMLTMSAGQEQHPALVIRDLSLICKEAEAVTWQPQFFREVASLTRAPSDATQTAALAAVSTAFLCAASAIVVATTSGEVVRLVSRLRPRCPIVSVTRSGTMARQNQLYRGVMSVHCREEPLGDWIADMEMRVQLGVMLTQNRAVTRSGDPVVLLHGWKRGTGFINTVRVLFVPESHDVQLLKTSPASGGPDPTLMTSPASGGPDPTLMTSPVSGGPDPTLMTSPVSGGPDPTLMTSPVSGGPDPTLMTSPASGGPDPTLMTSPVSGGPDPTLMTSPASGGPDPTLMTSPVTGGPDTTH